MQQPTRYLELDLLRTTAILLMVVYHFAFDLRYFYGWPIDVFHGSWWVLQKTTAITFLLVSGLSAAVSHHRMHQKNLTLQAEWLHIGKRASIILGAGLLVNIGTYAMDPDTYIRFGILHLIGTSALLLMFFASLREGTILLGLLLTLSTNTIRSALPPSVLLIPLGSPPTNFISLDYFPLLPWLGVILIGFGLGHFFYVRWTSWRKNQLFQLLETGHSKLETLTFPGRHSLLLYLLHQPLILLALWMTLG